MEWMFLLIVWLALWVLSSFFLKLNTKSKIISIGGGFIASLLFMMIIGIVFIKYKTHNNKIAISAGFDNYKEYKKYSLQGFETKSELVNYRDEQKKIAQRKKEELAKQRQAKRLEEKTRCKEDLQCWGEKHNLTASIFCDDKVEALAKYDFKWTDGILEPKFSHFRWRNQDKLIVTYIGDKIKFQNGFSAWQNYKYECDFDTQDNVALDVRALPGRIK